VAKFECQRLHHVAIIVDDLEAARAFYQGALQLDEIERPPFPVPGFWVQVGATQIHVGLGKRPTEGSHHFALEVDDVETAIGHLENVGIAVTRFPVIEGAGLQAGVSDPAGNRIEIRGSTTATRAR
jgi:glyoxylase I family protein